MQIEFNFEYKKTVQAINFLCVKNGGRVNKMAAMKLLFLADRVHLNTYGRSITGDSYCAMEHGPVLSTTWTLLSKRSAEAYGEARQEVVEYFQKYIRFVNQDFIASCASVKSDEFSDSDERCLILVCNRHLSMPLSDLIDFVHEFPEYKKAWGSGTTTREDMPIESLISNSEMLARAKLRAKAQEVLFS